MSDWLKISFLENVKTGTNNTKDVWISSSSIKKKVWVGWYDEKKHEDFTNKINRKKLLLKDVFI